MKSYSSIPKQRKLLKHGLQREKLEVLACVTIGPALFIKHLKKYKYKKVYRFSEF